MNRNDYQSLYHYLNGNKTLKNWYKKTLKKAKKKGKKTSLMFVFDRICEINLEGSVSNLVKIAKMENRTPEYLFEKFFSTIVRQLL